MNEQDPLKLDELGTAYEIVAELGRRENARVFRARYHSEGKRWDDVTEVLIAVSHAPQGDEENALSLYAADTRLLTRLPHRNLLRTLGGQWIGTDAFAVITEYPQHPSLAELLARREEFSSARIAAILQEIDGLLEWARSESVVHRGITANTLSLEPDTDRALVSFDITAIPLTGPLLPEVDSRTLAALAWTMLTRSAPPSSVEDMKQPLAEVRPDLSARAVSQTEVLLGL